MTQDTEDAKEQYHIIVSNIPLLACDGLSAVQFGCLRTAKKKFREILEAIEQAEKLAHGPESIEQKGTYFP